MKKTILITGAGSGIGKATAVELLRRGHHVIATAHTEEQVSELLELSLESFVLDITRQSDREKVHQYKIDVLINNAGVGETGSLAEIDIEKIRFNFEVNVFSTFALTQEVLKDMIPQNEGRIVFVSSLLGRTTSPFFGPYSMTKHSLSSGAKMMADELALLSKNLHVVVVEPGVYHTGFNQKMMSKKFSWMDTSSYFFRLKDQIKRNEDAQFDLIEMKSLESIRNKIIEACEATNPRFRYSSPWWQALYIQTQRFFGK